MNVALQTTAKKGAIDIAESSGVSQLTLTSKSMLVSFKGKRCFPLFLFMYISIDFGIISVLTASQCSKLTKGKQIMIKQLLILISESLKSVILNIYFQPAGV